VMTLALTEYDGRHTTYVIYTFSLVQCLVSRAVQVLLVPIGIIHQEHYPRNFFENSPSNRAGSTNITVDPISSLQTALLILPSHRRTADSRIS